MVGLELYIENAFISILVPVNYRVVAGEALNIPSGIARYGYRSIYMSRDGLP